MESRAEALESGEQALFLTQGSHRQSVEGNEVRLCFKGVTGDASGRLAYLLCRPNNRSVSCLQVYFLSCDMAGVSLQSLEALGVQTVVR